MDLSRRDEVAKRLEPACSAPEVILDLRGIDYIDTATLSELLVLRRKRIEAGLSPARLVLYTTSLRSIMALTHLDEMFPLFGSLTEAQAGT